MNPFEPRPPPDAPPAASPGPPDAGSPPHGPPAPGHPAPGYTTPGYPTPGHPAPGYTTPGYGVPGPEMPRLVSAGLPPGYLADEGGDEPSAILYLRLYCGLQALCSMVYGFYLGRGTLHEIAAGSHDRTSLFFFAIGSAVSTTIFAANVLGLLCPRQRWMYPVGTAIIGVSLLANSCCWLIGIPMLLAWLKPEVRRWFEG